MLIDEYIDGKNMYVKKTVDDINKTQKKLKSLLEDPTVVEFITEEENLKDLEKSKTISKIILSQAEEQVTDIINKIF